VRERDVDALEALLTLLAAAWVARTVADVLSPPARRAAVTEPWSEEPPPRMIPPPAFERCPRGHDARYRPSDGAVYCQHPDCDRCYYPSFEEVVAALPTREAA
jgi:hypothetical protein